FFFSSRRRHTRSKRDWSSDVCSSDLALAGMLGGALTFLILVITKPFALVSEPIIASPISLALVIVVSLMTAPPSAATQEQVNRYHADLSESDEGKSAG